MSLCARAVAEVQSLCQTSFRGVELESPKALCCARGCANVIGTLRDLSTAAIRAGGVNAVTTCEHGHATRLQPFVGMRLGAEDGHAAELLHWLRIVQCHACNDSGAVAGSDHGSEHGSVCDGGGDVGTTTPLSSTHMCISLATALVRWAAHTFHGAGTPSPCSPRVWVAVRRDNPASQPPTLVLRPVCEHPECLHAVRTQSRRAIDDITSLVAIRDDHLHGGGHTSTVPLRTLAERSGRVLAALTQAVAYGDEDEQTLHHEHVLAAVSDMLTVLPNGTQVAVHRMSELHQTLGVPLQWVPVVAHPNRAGCDVGVHSHLWLCKHHATDTELAQLRHRQHQSVEAVSMLVEWHWNDGQRLRVFDHVCTVALEHAWQSKLTQVTLSCSNHTQTVLFLTSGMVVKESGARVGRVSRKTYVCVCVRVRVRVLVLVRVTCCARNGHFVSRVWNCRRHPFPPHWLVPSSDNFTEEDLASGPEFNDVQQRLHDSLPDAMLIRLTRYVEGKSSSCTPQVSSDVFAAPQHPQSLSVAEVRSAM